MQKNRIKNFSIDFRKKVFFYFDNKKLYGFEGETLASALIANNIKLVGRSFKYHRPRGIIAIGSEEPNALVTINKGDKTEPNIQATKIYISEGLIAKSQNRWPNLKYDFGSFFSFFSKLIPAGFYYKTFMWPPNGWKTYEHFIRKMAGLGKAAEIHKDPDRYEHIHYHVDVLIVGGGISGLASCLTLANSNLKIMIADENEELGGNLNYENDVYVNSVPGKKWAKQTAKKLENIENVRILKRSNVFGYHDHNFITISENCEHQLSNKITQRLWKVRAKRVVLAQGLIERPIVFSGNDLPGVMLSSAVRGYANKYGVVLGKKAVICTNNDDAYRTALVLYKAGIKIQCIADLRDHVSSELVRKVQNIGIKIFFGHTLSKVIGRYCVKKVELSILTKEGKINSNSKKIINADLIAVSGGWTPAVNLFSQSGGKLKWDNHSLSFKPSIHFQNELTIGGCNGTFDYEKTVIESIDKTKGIIKDFTNKKIRDTNLKIIAPKFNKSTRSTWFTKSSEDIFKNDKAFVDFQNDVTVSDILLASNEGYNSVEHLKRYTTLGMGTDQGKTSNINGLEILSTKLTKGIPEIGTTTFRMPYSPVRLGLIGGRDISELFDPVRLTKIDPWHRLNKAKYEHVGQWMRAWYYPQNNENIQTAVNREVLNTRMNAGILDASTLGKIDIKGKDSRKFLNMIYTNDWSLIKPGQCKYGIMLNEDGMVMDDGVTTCIKDNHFHMTTTTGGSTSVLSWLEEWSQTEWPHLDVNITSVTENWSVLSLSGPKAREILFQSGCDIDLSNKNFPFMTFKNGKIGGIPVRIFRISFTGELSYEINTPSRYGLYLWQKILKSGGKFNLMPYGTEAMHVLRAEKGFIIVGQETDGSVSPLDLGMDWIISKKKKDFIGKRSLKISSTIKNRKELVGILTENSKQIIPEGAHAIEDEKSSPPVKMIGHVTSSYYSPNCNRSIALALIKGGRTKIGQKVFFPTLEGNIITGKLVKPNFFDPNGDRLNGI